MKMINKINYEQFAIDYLEGNLSGDLLVEMNEFLTANSDIKEELEEMKLYYLEADEQVVYEGKDDLVRPVGGKKKFFVHPFFLMTSIAILFIVMIGFFLLPNTNSEKNITNTILETTNNTPLVIDNNNNTKKVTTNINHSEETTTTIKEDNNNQVSNETKDNVIIPKKENTIQQVKDKPRNMVTKKVIPSTTTKKPIYNNPIIKIIEPVLPVKKQKSEPIAQVNEPRLIENSIPERNNISLEPLQLARFNINPEEITIEHSLAIIETPERESILRRTGLLPENEDRKINFRNIKEALTPEFFASKD